MILRRLIFIMIFSMFTINSIVQAQECTAQSEDAWKVQADNDYDLGNYTEAIAGYTCMITLGGDLVSEGYEWRGVSYQSLGELDNALEDLNIAVTNPNNDSAYNSRGNVFYELGNYELALADYTQAINSGYSWSFVYNNRGLAHSRLGDEERALNDYQTAVALDSENGAAYNNIGVYHFYNGDMDSALENYELALRNSSGINRAIPTSNQAEVAYLDGDYTTAIQGFGTAIELDPDFVSAYLYRANTYRATQSPNAYADYLRYVQAIETQIVDIEDDDPRLFHSYFIRLDEGVVYRTSYFLTAGQYLSFRAVASRESEADPLILLLSPSGNAIMGDDDSGSNYDAVINRFPIAEDGIYTVLVTHSHVESTGDVSLTANIRDDRIQNLIKQQLAIGERAEIFALSNDGPGIINLRSYPSTGFEVLARLESGTEVAIINGPHKDDGFIWWQVETDDGIRGWMVEYLGDVQILSPAIGIGRTVGIDTVELNLRDAPSVSGNLVGTITVSEPTDLTVIDGPVEADGLVWWKLRTEGEQQFEAWAVERVGNNRTLTVVLDN